MEIVTLSNKDLKKLNKYQLHTSIENTESDIYIYNNHELLKIIKNKQNIFHKFYLLNKLFYIEKNLDFKEIVFPNNIVKLSKVPAGYIMDFITNNTNIGRILKDNISFEDKKFFLNQIGNILNKIEKNELLKSLNFHLGDIHEYNFIYDNKNNMVRVIDIDSAYVNGITAPTSKFLTFNDKLWDFPNKYPIDIENNRHIPNKNTTILSYYYILLNILTNEYSPDFSIDKFCEILNMLNSVGVNKTLLDSIYNVYFPKDNYIDYDLINDITEKQYNDFKTLQLKKY